MKNLAQPILLVLAALALGCGDGSTPPTNSETLPRDDGFIGETAPTVTVTFESHCSNPVDTFATNPTGSSCTRVASQVTPTVADANAYSASTSGSGECTTGTRVEITPGSNGDVSFDISTNGSYPQQPTPYFNVPVQFLALQRTAPTRCALPEWNGGRAADDLRGVSTQVCADATCPTAYQTPTSGPQFIVRDTATSAFVVEWCPTKNPSPIPTCDVPQYSASDPCAFVCWANAVQSAFPCEQNPGHVMCDVDPFGGTPPASYCLLDSDCSKDGKPCGCCTSDTDCTGGKTCTNFLCQ